MVVGAVHRLEVVLDPLHLHGREHRLGVVRQVAAAHEHLVLADVGGAHLQVPGLALGLLRQPFQLLDQDRPLRLPQGQAGADLVVEEEQLQLAPETAVVPLLRLLQHAQVPVEGLAAGEGGAVDALQHLVALVAAPVGAGHAEQLVVADLSRAQHVGPAAEVDEVAVAVEGEGLTVLEIVEDLQLVGLVPKAVAGLAAADLLALEAVVLADHPLHLLLDPAQVVGGEGLGHVEVVVEPVVDRRPDGQPRLGEEAPHRLGHDVGQAVAVDPPGLVGLPGDELDLVRRLELRVEVDPLVPPAGGDELPQQLPVVFEEDLLEVAAPLVLEHLLFADSESSLPAPVAHEKSPLSVGFDSGLSRNSSVGKSLIPEGPPSNVGHGYP